MEGATDGVYKEESLEVALCLMREGFATCYSTNSSDFPCTIQFKPPLPPNFFFALGDGGMAGRSGYPKSSGRVFQVFQTVARNLQEKTKPDISSSGLPQLPELPRVKKEEAGTWRSLQWAADEEAGVRGGGRSTGQRGPGGEAKADLHAQRTSALHSALRQRDGDLLVAGRC